MNENISYKRIKAFPTLIHLIESSELIDETIEVFNKSVFPDDAPYASDTIYELSSNPSLVAKFESKVNGVLEDLKFQNKFRMTTSWFTCTYPNTPIHTHNHVNCMWAASFYFFNGCSPLHLVKDKSQIYVPFGTDDPELMVSGTVSVQATRGCMVLFPSSLHHYISKNTANHNRYSLAMNFMPEGLCSFYDSEYNYRHDPL
jgi:uncharacterized protein (TIGR02466 family)